MKALITAGGKGIRMQLDTPQNKCLLQVGSKSILEHSVVALQDAGVTDISIITGFCSGDVERVIGAQATYIHHSTYETEGLIASIYRARHEFANQPFVLIMGDALYHPAMLHKTLETDGDVVVTYEVKDSYVPEDSKLIEKDGLVQYMGKDIPPTDCSGEFGHMIKFSPKGAALLFAEIAVFLEEGKPNVYLMAVINQIISKHMSVTALNVTGVARTEIDFQEDLEEARTEYAAGVFTS